MAKRSRGRGKKVTSRKPGGGNVNPMLKQLVTIETTLRNQNKKPEPAVRDPIWQQPSSGSKIYSFFRTAQLANISSVTPIEVDGQYAPTLDTFPDYTEFTSLFDNYRIRMFKFMFIPRALPISTTSVATAFGVIGTAFDPDGGPAVAMTALEEYASFQMVPMGAEFERTIVPHAANPVYNGSVFTSFARVPNTAWIDCTSANVPYYSLNYSISVGSISVAVYDVFVTARIEFQVSR
jgi:hypothetical protein